MSDHKQKALEAIEKLVSDDFCADMEVQLMENKLKTEEEEAMAEKIGEIYRIAHAHSGHCGNPHFDWRVSEE